MITDNTRFSLLAYFWAPGSGDYYEFTENSVAKEGDFLSIFLIDKNKSSDTIWWSVSGEGVDQSDFSQGETDGVSQLIDHSLPIQANLQSNYQIALDGETEAKNCHPLLFTRTH